jgi:DNA modification methylase
MSPSSTRAARGSHPAPVARAATTLEVELWPIERPIPYGQNPRLCPPAAIEKVAASLRAYGFRQPIVVDREGVVIAGHTRLLAARKLGLAEVPVHVADLTPEQAHAYRLADNRTAEETGWNAELLASEIGALAEIDYDLSLLGFNDDELGEILGLSGAGLTDPDLIPEAPAEPISKPGDLWTLGEHRLLCGDATKAEDVVRLMDGKRAAAMVTDPPYLLDYDGGNHPQTWRGGRKISGAEKTKHWDAYVDRERSVAFYSAFLTLALEHALIANAAVYQWYASARVEIVLAAWRAAGLLAHQQLIWHKSRSVLTRCDYMWDYEPFLYGWPAGHRPARKPPANASAVWEIASGGDDVAGVHPTQKPVELIRRPITYHTKVGEAIYEPFCGSGTALIAAEMSGRRCCAIELSPAFVDVAITRWCNFSGREAVRHD